MSKDAKRCQKMPNVAKTCKQISKVAKKMPKDAKSCQKMKADVKSCQKMPKVAKSCQKLPKGRPKRAILWANWSPFVSPNSHKSSLLAPKKIIRWPKVTRSWYIRSWYLLWSMTHFWTIGAHLGALKRPFYKQISPVGTPQMAEIPYKASKMHCTFGDHPDGASSDIWEQIW